MNSKTSKQKGFNGATMKKNVSVKSFLMIEEDKDALQEWNNMKHVGVMKKLHKKFYQVMI
jgi:hypothetical protein